MSNKQSHMKVEIEWHDVKDLLPINGSVVLVLSTSTITNRWRKNTGLFGAIDKDTKPEFYVHGNPDTDVVYWAYFPEMPEYPKDK